MDMPLSEDYSVMNNRFSRTNDKGLRRWSKMPSRDNKPLEASPEAQNL